MANLSVVVLRLPEIVGGVILECIGGPLDGQWLYFASGEDVVHIGHFFDPQHTIWVNAARPGDSNYLGYYSPGAGVPRTGGSIFWHTTEGD